MTPGRRWHGRRSGWFFKGESLSGVHTQGKFSAERESFLMVGMAVRRAPSSGQILDRVTLETLRSRVLPAFGK